MFQKELSDRKQVAIYASGIILLGILIMITQTVFAKQFTFRNYQVNQGLSENSVHSIIQDNQGFMWFGTKDGLNRFDGRTFKVFKDDLSDEHSIGNNFTRTLFQHHDGTIWVGTDNGVYIYNPINEQFTFLDVSTADEKSIESTVTSICSDADNSMWIGTMTNGVFRYNELTHELNHYSTNEEQNSLHSDVVWKVYKDRSGTIWIGTRRGLSRFNKETESFFTYNDTSQPNGLSDTEILTIYEDHDGDLWLGTWAGGLSRLNRSSNTFKTWFDNDHSTYISHIRAIYEYDKDQLLIGADDGLYLFNKVTEAYQRIDDPKDIHSLSDQNVYAITKDTEGGLWIGTYFGGVSYVSPLSKYIAHHYPNHSPNSMSGKAVSQFIEDDSGNLWVATEDGGLNYFNRKNQTFKVFLPDDNKESISYHNIHSLLHDGDHLWIGTFSRGIDVFDVRNNIFENYRHDQNNIQTIDDDCIFALYKTRKGDILVGTPYGLSRFIPERNYFERVQQVRAFVYSMAEDHLGNLWVTTYDKGIYRYIESENKWYNYVHNPRFSNTIGSNKVIAVYLDNQQRLWFGTEGRGLYRYNYESDDFTGIDETHGLPNNVVYGILDDTYGNIWVSTNGGLSVINPVSLMIKTYTSSDGLQSNQFNYRSSYKSSDGTFFFGGINGFNSFKPDNLKINEQVPPVRITGIELLDVDAHQKKGFRLNQDSRNHKKITLKHNQASIRINFVSLSYLAPSKNEYAYRMDFYNTQWIPASKNPEATYINLPPGKYTFRVRGSNNDGIWNDAGDSLEIVILPPFWRTTFASVLYAIIILALFTLAFNYYDKQSKAKHKENLKIYKEKKEEEAYRSKINFFTTVAHEIRTPVSLIKAPLECIINSRELSSETKDNLLVIEKNSEQLIQLVNQLLDFRKIEENTYPLNLTHTNISKLIQDICFRFKPTINRANIKLHVEIPEQEIFANVDREAMTKIINNLLANALKYTKSFINISLSVDQANEHLQITVADNGEGIDQEFREKVFQPFYQITRPNQPLKHSGTGIGLTLTKLLVERHKGTIYIEDVKDYEGCIFRISIPLALQAKVAETPVSEAPENPLFDVSDHEKTTSESSLLIVEDNDDLLEFLRNNLKQEYNILMATNGEEAIHVLENHHVDVIVSDVMMPVMDGVELVSRVKQDEQLSHIPIVLLSAKTNIEIKVDGLESGADCYIDKPFSIEFLKAQIYSLIRNRIKIQEKFAKSPNISYSAIASNKKDTAFINKLNDEIEKNLTDSEYSIDKLAQAIAMSRSNLQRKIKGLTGLAPNDYIKIYKLKKSARLLQSTSYRINEVCFLAGFNNPSYFSKCFQKQFGVLPKEFTRRYESKGIIET
jgi:ligand-binding sensor domain-containing protein/signal transduction histidine kinase/DNA-binding response OmpR family regulator